MTECVIPGGEPVTERLAAERDATPTDDWYWQGFRDGLTRAEYIVRESSDPCAICDVPRWLHYPVTHEWSAVPMTCPDCGHPAAGHTHPDENIACTAIGCSCPRGDLLHDPDDVVMQELETYRKGYEDGKAGREYGAAFDGHDAD